MASTTYDRDEDWDNGEELTLLGSGDDRLPWLESADEDEAVGGFDTQRIVLVAALALALLAAVVGGLWFVSNVGGASEPEADGSMIAAPDTPYKTKPKNQGGKTFAGTGDTSFAVGEGQTREGQLASRPAPEPSADPVKPSLASTVDEAPRPVSEQPISGVGVQVGAFPSRADAEAGWAALIRQTEALSGVSHRVVEGRADIGRVYRLQAVAGSRSEAQRLCGALKADGLACFVK